MATYTYNAGESLDDAAIKDLKTRVNAEMKRRKYNNSLASYNASFTTAANTGSYVYYSHFYETVRNINLIKATGVTAATGAYVDSIQAAVTRFTNTNEGRSITTSSSDCTTGCRGLCTTGCGSTCKGCDGCDGCTGCSGGCTNACTGCTNACSGCKGSCTGQVCSGACTGRCGGNV